MPGVGLTVRVVGLGSEDPELKSHSSIELISGGVDSTCHPAYWYPVLERLPVQDCAQQPRRLLRQHQCSAQSMVPMDGWTTTLLTWDVPQFVHSIKKLQGLGGLQGFE